METPEQTSGWNNLPLSTKIKYISIILLAVLFTIFIIQNLEKVTLDVFFWSFNVRFRTLRILIAVRPHTERVRIARPEKISRRIVQRQQRQSRLPAATKLSRSDMDVVVVLKGMTTSLSSFRAELLSRAASRSPARVIVSGGEGRSARPRAADEQLVGGGQGVCVLCRESKGGRVYNGGRGACREAGERVRGGSVGMHGARLSKGWGPRARAERTENMRNMVLTLEVSKLSGWLKADAACRVEGRGHMRCGEGEVRAGRRERAWGVVAAHKRHARGWPDPRLGGMRGAHVEHVAYVRDAGGVEAQRLVEGRRALPSRREGMRCGGERCEPGGGRACGVVAARQAARTGKRPGSRLGGQGHARSARRTCGTWS